MVQQWKKKLSEEIAEEIKQYPVVGIVDAYKLPSKQFQDIKSKIKDKAKIKIVKKRVLYRAMDKAKVSKDMLEKLNTLIIPGILLTKDNPFKVYKYINKNKSPTFAKAGDIAPRDIVVPAGNTGLPPGPVIGELKSAGIKAKIEGNSIVVTEDSLVVKEGEVIDEKKANILMKLNIQPMEIGINVVAMEEQGTLYPKDLLEVDEEKYLLDITEAYRHAFNLAYNADYYVNDIMPYKMGEAYTKAINLGVNAVILEKEILPEILSKAQAHMLSLASQLPSDARGNVVVNTSQTDEKGNNSQDKQQEIRKEEKVEENKKEEAAAGLGALFG